MPTETPLHLLALQKAKSESGLTFAQLADKIAKPEVWTAAVFYGQARPDEETAAAIVNALTPGSNVMIQTPGSADRIAVSPDIMIQELSGKGQSNLGVQGMVVRNETVESVPRVCVLVHCSERARADESDQLSSGIPRWAVPEWARPGWVGVWVDERMGQRGTWLHGLAGERYKSSKTIGQDARRVELISRTQSCTASTKP